MRQIVQYGTNVETLLSDSQLFTLLPSPSSSSPSLPSSCRQRFLPESVRWLKTKGHAQQAERVLQQVARWNRRSMPGKELLNTLDLPQEQAKKTYTYLHIFKPHLAKATLLGGFMW